MSRLRTLLPILFFGCATTPEPVDTAEPRQAFGVADLAELRQQVWDTELAFADTMALRDHEAFTSFLSEDAIFFGGGEPLRGKAAVAAGWAPYFTGPAAPFAWEPDMVEVLQSGDLALSSGPVIGPTGAAVGRFTSIWRLEPDGWRIVLDKGDS